MKRCSKCRAEKSLNDFYKNAAKADGLQNQCKPCCLASIKASTASDPARRLRVQKRYREASSDVCKTSDAAWRAKDPQRAAELDAAKSRKWRAANPEKVREITVAAHTRLKRATVPWSESEPIKVIYAKAFEWGFEVDHVVPLKGEIVSGLHVHANLQLLDRPLNIAKGNRTWPDMP